eukprot:5367841-Pleurochrysis_carterae.AAC.1
MHATCLCLGAVKLVTKPSNISARVRSWTDGRLVSLRDKTVVTSHLVTFTCSYFVLHVCRFHSCVGLYGSNRLLIHSRRPTYACAHGIVRPRCTESLRPRLRAPAWQRRARRGHCTLRPMTILPYKRLALEAARRKLGVCRVFNFDRVRCGKRKLVLMCQYTNI